MKQSDIITIVLITMIGTIAAGFIVNGVLGNPDDAYETWKTVEVVDASLADPNPDTFNADAINPTVEVYVGNCVDRDADGKLSYEEQIACGWRSSGKRVLVNEQGETVEVEENSSSSSSGNSSNSSSSSTPGTVPITVEEILRQREAQNNAQNNSSSNSSNSSSSNSSSETNNSGTSTNVTPEVPNVTPTENTNSGTNNGSDANTNSGTNSNSGTNTNSGNSSGTTDVPSVEL